MACLMHMWISVPFLEHWGWHWVTRGTSPVGQETINNQRELAAALLTFGEAASYMVTGVDAYTISAYGARDGLIYGRAEWHFEPRLRAYIPAGDPLCPREVGGPLYRKEPVQPTLQVDMADCTP